MVAFRTPVSSLLATLHWRLPRVQLTECKEAAKIKPAVEPTAETNPFCLGGFCLDEEWAVALVGGSGVVGGQVVRLVYSCYRRAPAVRHGRRTVV